jgi:hypothetical protein
MYLTDIFNAIPDGNVQYKVLLDTIKYSKQAGLAGALATVVKVSLQGVQMFLSAPLSVDHGTEVAL